MPCRLGWRCVLAAGGHRPCDASDGTVAGVTILHGDSRLILPTLDSGRFQQVVTSPPYWAQRRYGDDDHEIGWGRIEDYLDDMVQVMNLCAHVTDEDATAWVVMGSKRTGSGGAGGDHAKNGSKHWIKQYGKADYGALADGQDALIPQRFALQTQEQTPWIVRCWIVWDKSPNVKPEDPKHINRPMMSSEVIILFAKKVRHRWHPSRLAEPGDVWHIAPRRLPSAQKAHRHFAPYPEEIPRRTILAATEAGDEVLDPFGGSHTTLRVGEELGRPVTSIELYGA